MLIHLHMHLCTRLRPRPLHTIPTTRDHADTSVWLPTQGVGVRTWNGWPPYELLWSPRPHVPAFNTVFSLTKMISAVFWLAQMIPIQYSDWWINATFSLTEMINTAFWSAEMKLIQHSHWLRWDQYIIIIDRHNLQNLINTRSSSSPTTIRNNNKLFWIPKSITTSQQWNIDTQTRYGDISIFYRYVTWMLFSILIWTITWMLTTLMILLEMILI